jgi:dTDP-glucose pyrophosphorylase
MNMSNELWRQTLLHGDATINDAIGVLNVSGLRIVLAVDENEKLLGTISDGDIRRGLLKGLKLENSVAAIWNHDAIVVSDNMSSEMVKELMLVNKIQQIPIVDKNQRLIGLHLWNEFAYPVSRQNIFVIMAGGRGTRLGTQTENCPKPLLLVAGRPILEHIINRAQNEGFKHFVLAINYLGHMIEEYFGNGDRFGVTIEYLREKVPLGTAGALSLLSPTPNLPLIVTNGDVLTNIQYGAVLDFHEKNNAIGTMAVRLHEWENPFGVVVTDGNDIIGYEEKPILRSSINAGIYVLEPTTLKFLNEFERCDMPTLFEKMRDNSFKTIAYPLHEEWLDVGLPGDLRRAQSEKFSSRISDL